MSDPLLKNLFKILSLRWVPLNGFEVEGVDGDYGLFY